MAKVSVLPPVPDVCCSVRWDAVPVRRAGAAGRPALARANTHLDDGLLVVHLKVGALHEVAGDLYLGPPKTTDSARNIHLPPFLITN
jgi:hypothetical protein